MDLASALPDTAISLRVSAPDWRDAVRFAGQALVASGVTLPGYTEDMIDTIDRLGPYVVIAPGIALAHARPSSDVLRAGISWVSLAHPVEFGNAANDPVLLVLGLAALDHDGHLELMAALAQVLADAELMRTALTATAPDQLRSMLRSGDPSELN
ncbi:MAG: PTS sugar transporter subunit IIA [Propionicimonas sp.]|nr:PTS sugar transporter subunit IIA [Propionicimonas sp.]